MGCNVRLFYLLAGQHVILWLFSFYWPWGIYLKRKCGGLQGGSYSLRPPAWSQPGQPAPAYGGLQPKTSGHPGPSLSLCLMAWAEVVQDGHLHKQWLFFTVSPFSILLSLFGSWIIFLRTFLLWHGEANSRGLVAGTLAPHASGFPPVSLIVFLGCCLCVLPVALHTLSFHTSPGHVCLCSRPMVEISISLSHIWNLHWFSLIFSSFLVSGRSRSQAGGKTRHAFQCCRNWRRYGSSLPLPEEPREYSEVTS